MKILGIDPGYDRLGVAIIEKSPKTKDHLIYSDCLQTSKKNSIHERLKEVGDFIASTLSTHSPDALAIETLFMSTNKTTAMRVSEARGIIIYEAMKAGIPVFEYNPMQIKTAVTGDGTSDKQRILKMLSLIIKLPEKKALDDEYDAIAVALTHGAHARNIR